VLLEIGIEEAGGRDAGLHDAAGALEADADDVVEMALL
jgi:hypothetical protein